MNFFQYLSRKNKTKLQENTIHIDKNSDRYLELSIIAEQCIEQFISKKYEGFSNEITINNYSRFLPSMVQKITVKNITLNDLTESEQTIVKDRAKQFLIDYFFNNKANVLWENTYHSYIDELIELKDGQLKVKASHWYIYGPHEAVTDSITCICSCSSEKEIIYNLIQMLIQSVIFYKQWESRSTDLLYKTFVRQSD